MAIKSEVPKVYQIINHLNRQEKENVLGYLLNALQQDITSKVNETWTDEELAEIFRVREPLTGKQIVEKHLASGVIGSWADENINTFP